MPCRCMWETDMCRPCPGCRQAGNRERSHLCEGLRCGGLSTHCNLTNIVPPTHNLDTFNNPHQCWCATDAICLLICAFICGRMRKRTRVSSLVHRVWVNFIKLIPSVNILFSFLHYYLQFTLNMLRLKPLHISLIMFLG